jgi:hypothetical protein
MSEHAIPHEGGRLEERFWHYPEAFEGADEFRSLRCCGPVLLTASSSLHDPSRKWGVRSGRDNDDFLGARNDRGLLQPVANAPDTR